LCGSGLISLETAYPLTLGSNIGTTTTSIIASFAAEGKYLKPSIQTALVHLFFNVIAILIFYPIPFMRWPIGLARKLGDLTADYRWFATLYLILSFFVIPIIVFGLSVAGTAILYIVLGIISSVIIIVTIINFLQKNMAKALPNFLRTWDFLPLWMHSLEPLDNLFQKIPICSKCTSVNNTTDPVVQQEHFESGKVDHHQHVSGEEARLKVNSSIYSPLKNVPSFCETVVQCHPN